MALRADTRLRELSDGRESLDTVLGKLAECCLPSPHSWHAEELFAKLDSLSSEPVFMDLYREMAGKRGMPDLSSLYTDLGLIEEDGKLRLEPSGRLLEVRRAIMTHSY